MMKLITNIMGAVLCALAVVGFFNHGAFGMNLNLFHDVLLLGAGAVALYFGIRGTEFEARYCCRALGAIFAAVGVLGLVSGPGAVTITDLLGRESTHLLKLMPGHLELTTYDTVLNLILGAVGLVAGFFPREMEIEIDVAAQEAAKKAAKTVAKEAAAATK